MNNKDQDFTVVVRDAGSLATAMERLSMLVPTESSPYTVTVKQEDEARSLKQNRLSFLWYRLRGTMTGHGTDYEREICKLLYGVPILREDKDFNEFYHYALSPLEYDQQRKAMAYVPVTRLMKVGQFAEYLEAIDRESAAIGIVLPHPEDLYWDALMKEVDRE